MSESAPLSSDDLYVAQHQVSEIVSLLSQTTDADTLEDLHTLQEFYKELEQRRTSLGNDLADEGRLDGAVAPKGQEVEAAVRFMKFLKSMDASDDTTKVLLKGCETVVATLGLVERNSDFLENVPMQSILEMYERIKSREERLQAGGRPVPLKTARIYLTETTAFAEMVQVMVTLDKKTRTADEAVSAESVGVSGAIQAA
ncbi:hypothetical protein B0H11DRAFT_1988478 [Mycena galericulata]|nr:hypothetical protein B0H11DRAFT_1988478 [Mycena galericulata]